MVTEMDHAVAGSQPVLNHPLNFADAESGFERHAPALGEHTEAVLRDLGYDDGAIAEFARHGTVGDLE
jgi:crotonobetainyl-CoA:carnitine CoA-transferase CaiB-like acyl-CoA transferase